MGAADRPDRSRLWVLGLYYEVDLQRCRQARVDWALKNPANPRENRDLASAAQVSGVTLWRFFAGHQISHKSIGRILGVLGLRFQDVATPAP